MSVYCYVFLFFFFKQKTAYEMRISDWSSDVCSSDLEHIRSERFVFRHHDLTEHLDVPEPVDVVFHLASPASPINYMRLPLHTLKVGSYGTHNGLGQIGRASCRESVGQYV